MRFIGKLNIKAKFIIVIAVSSILPIIVLGIYSYDTSIKSITEQTKNRSATTLNRVSAFMDLYLQQINDYAVNIANSSLITEVLTDTKNNPLKYDGYKKSVYLEMQLLNEHMNLPLKAMIIMPSSDFFSSFDFDNAKLTDAIRKIEADDWYLQNNTYSNVTRFIGIKKSYIEDFETEYHFYFCRSLYDDEGHYSGILLIDISSYVFDRLLGSIVINSEDIIYLLDEKSNVLSVSNESSDLRNKAGEDIQKVLGSNENQADGGFVTKDLIVAKVQLINSKWYLVYFIDKASISDSTDRIILFTIGLILVLLLLEFFLYLLVSKTITSPIIELSKAMKKVEQSDFEVKFNTSATDEIGILANGFNKMVVEIKDSIEKIKQEERHAKKFELAMLQAQINPHFLYNSLNSIKWMADLMGCSNISRAILCMVKLLQYSIDKVDSTITLKNEIEYIESYIYLNNIRFHNKFNFEKKTDPKYDNIKIIKFLIQPLVENSILHGLKDKPGMGNIEFTIEEKENTLILSIIDDGTGFQSGEPMKDYLGNDKNKTIPAHIGLENVNRRLKLIYGEEYGIIIRSEIDIGTKVSVVIPFDGRWDSENTGS